MKLSQSSKTSRDPLSDVLDVLGSRVTRRTQLEAAGDWALSFPGIDRLKFVALHRGQCWIGLPGQAPHQLQAGEVCLLGPVGYTVSSDPVLPPVDGMPLFAGTDSDTVRIGGDEMVAIGGTVTFAGHHADFLLNMMPNFMTVQRHTPGADAISTILSLMSEEADRGAIGSGIVSARLTDVLLVESMRAYAEQIDPAKTGWFGALLDPRIGRALRALHEDVARAWTVSDCAAVAGMSRAAFSAEFTRRVGQPPLSYLRLWRLTIARNMLSRGEVTVADVAHAVGYHSQSAFSQAFLRTFGVSPKAEARAKSAPLVHER